MKKAIIKEGRHRSNISFFVPYLNKYIMSYSVQFTNSCEYELVNNDQYDINKLFGLSFGWHHKNSARFGWRWNTEKKKIEILAYVYVNGKRVNEWDQDIVIADDIELNSKIFIDLYVYPETYLFIVSSKSVTYCKEVKHGKLFPLGYRLYPYFGGNRKAPHDIIIDFEKIY